MQAEDKMFLAHITDASPQRQSSKNQVCLLQLKHELLQKAHIIKKLMPL